MTLAGITGLPLDRLSAGVGRICAPVSLIVPAYLIAVMGGWKALRGVLPAAAVCGIAFAGTQFLVSNFVGPQLTDILARWRPWARWWRCFKLWKPRDRFRSKARPPQTCRHANGRSAVAWAPYGLLVIFVLLWGYKPVQAQLDSASHAPWPGLHNLIERMPPAVGKPRHTPRSSISTGSRHPARRAFLRRFCRRSCGLSPRSSRVYSRIRRGSLFWRRSRWRQFWGWHS